MSRSGAQGRVVVVVVAEAVLLQVVKELGRQHAGTEEADAAVVVVVVALSMRHREETSDVLRGETDGRGLSEGGCACRPRAQLP